jgi:hypothetical protein
MLEKCDRTQHRQDSLHEGGPGGVLHTVDAGEGFQCPLYCVDFVRRGGCWRAKLGRWGREVGEIFGRIKSRGPGSAGAW